MHRIWITLRCSRLCDGDTTVNEETGGVSMRRPMDGDDYVEAEGEVNERRLKLGLEAQRTISRDGTLRMMG